MLGACSPRTITQQNTGSRAQAAVLLCCHCPEGHGARAETQLTAQRAAYLDHFHHLGGDDVLLYHVLDQLLQDQLLRQHHPVLLQRFLVTALHAARPQHPTWVPHEGPPRAGAAPHAAEEASSTRPDGPCRGAARSPSHRRIPRPRSARAPAFPRSRQRARRGPRDSNGTESRRLRMRPPAGPLPLAVRVRGLARPHGPARACWPQRGKGCGKIGPRGTGSQSAWWGQRSPSRSKIGLMEGVAAEVKAKGLISVE